MILMSPFDIAWSVLKALPEDQMFIEDGGGRYGIMPEQERHGTVHPAIRGLLQRRNRGVGLDGYTDFNQARPSMQIDRPQHWTHSPVGIEDLGSFYEDDVQTMAPRPGSSQASLDYAQGSHGLKIAPYFEDEDRNFAFFAQHPTRLQRQRAFIRHKGGQPMTPPSGASRFSSDSVPYKDI